MLTVAHTKPFLPLWQQDLRTGDDVPREEIYFALVEALHRDPSGASFIAIDISGVPTACGAFAHAAATVRGGGGGPATSTPPALNTVGKAVASREPA